MAPTRIPMATSTRGLCRTNAPALRRISQSVPCLSRGDTLFLIGVKKQPFLIPSTLLSGIRDSFNQQSEVIEIADVEPEAFGILQRFLYVQDKRPFRTFRGGSGCTTDSEIKLFLSAYHLGHKYNISSFLKHLEESLSCLLSPENVLEALVHADHFRSPSLKSYCWSLIERFTAKVVHSANFTNLRLRHLCDILENSHLTIGELELFLAVERWCRANSGTGKVDYKMYNIIGVACHNIRFPLMTPQQFEYVLQAKVLQEEEIEDLKRSHRSQIFISRPRSNKCGCRTRKNNCPLCILAPLLSNLTKSIDGKVFHLRGNELYKAVQKWCDDGEELLCECAKYVSCPAFPKGATNILRQELVKRRELNA